jgi:two-component system sensor kinase FixL
MAAGPRGELLRAFQLLQRLQAKAHVLLSRKDRGGASATPKGSSLQGDYGIHLPVTFGHTVSDKKKGRKPEHMPSDDRANEILRRISEGYVLLDADFRIRKMNEEAFRLDGRTADQLIGKTAWEAWPQYTPETPLGNFWTSVMSSRAPALMEQVSVRSHRDPIWLEVRAFPSGDGIAVFYRDITDRRQSEEELKRAQSELIHASRISAMGSMASTLAHELAQPLTSVSNYIGTAERMLRPNSDTKIGEAARAVGMAGAAARRASEILRRLRAFVSKRQVEAGAHDLQDVIADACVLMLPHAQRHNVEIRFELDRFARWILVDAVQIQQVLINLVKNSIEAMEGCDEKLITITSRVLGDGGIEVSVSDTGPGIGAAGDDVLFAPFVSGKTDGLGVGLSISRTIVEAHGGVIVADRSAGKGATFRFTLPRAAEPDANAA